MEVLLEAGEFGFEFGAFVGWRGGGNERPGLIGGVSESAVEPECDLPGKFEGVESGAMIVLQGVVRVITRFTDFAEELGNLARQDAVILQPLE